MDKTVFEILLGLVYRAKRHPLLRYFREARGHDFDPNPLHRRLLVVAWRDARRGEARRGEARRGDREQYDCYESMVSDPPPHVYPLRPPTLYAHHSFPEEKLGTVTFSFASCGEREGNEKKKHIHTHTHLYICCCYFVAFRSLESYWLAGDSPPPHHPPDPLPTTDITHLFLFLPSPSLL